MAVVATAERGLIVYQLENQPSEFRRIDSPLKHQVSFHPLGVDVSVPLTAELSRSTSCPAPLCRHIQGQTEQTYRICSGKHRRASGHSLHQPPKPVSTGPRDRKILT